jgi:Lipid A 3-O-deacylase (PagL)
MERATCFETISPAPRREVSGRDPRGFTSAASVDERAFEHDGHAARIGQRHQRHAHREFRDRRGDSNRHVGAKRPGRRPHRLLIARREGAQRVLHAVRMLSQHRVGYVEWICVTKSAPTPFDRRSRNTCARVARCVRHEDRNAGIRMISAVPRRVTRRDEISGARRAHRCSFLLRQGSIMRSSDRFLSRLLLMVPLFAASAASCEELAVGVGAFDVLHGARSVEFHGEYQSDTRWIGLHPIAGGMVTTRGALWGGAGVALPIDLGSSWLLRPTGLVGLYSRGNDKRLGAAVEFRAGIELGYRFASGTLGLVFTHFSNAGLTAGNPGAESLALRWAWRL